MAKEENLKLNGVNKKGGFQLVEVIVGSAIFMVVLLAVGYAMLALELTNRKSLRTTQATFLMNELSDSLRVVRDQGFDNIGDLTTGTTYYIDFQSGNWTITTTATPVDNFSRFFTVSDVYRDASDDIASSGALDSGGKKINATVSWNDGQITRSVNSEFYLFDI